MYYRLRRYGPVHSGRTAVLQTQTVRPCSLRLNAVLQTQTVRPCSLRTYRCPTDSDGTALFNLDLTLSYTQTVRPCSLQTYRCPRHSDGMALFTAALPFPTHSDGTALFTADLRFPTDSDGTALFTTDLQCPTHSDGMVLFTRPTAVYILRRYGPVHSRPTAVLHTQTVRPCCIHNYRHPTNSRSQTRLLTSTTAHHYFVRSREHSQPLYFSTFYDTTKTAQALRTATANSDERMAGWMDGLIV